MGFAIRVAKFFFAINISFKPFHWEMLATATAPPRKVKKTGVHAGEIELLIG